MSPVVGACFARTARLRLRPELGGPIGWIVVSDLTGRTLERLLMGHRLTPNV